VGTDTLVIVSKHYHGVFSLQSHTNDACKTEVRKIVVKDEGCPVRWLNELEYISNEIWSNVFQVSDPSQV
jgi:glutamine cyclotransferase